MAKLTPSPMCLPMRNAVADVHIPSDGLVSPLANATLHCTAYLEPSYNSKRSAIDHATPGVGCELPVKKLLHLTAFVVPRALHIHGGFNPVALNASPLVVLQPSIVPPSIITLSSSADVVTMPSTTKFRSKTKPPLSSRLKAKSEVVNAIEVNRKACVNNYLHECSCQTIFDLNDLEYNEADFKKLNKGFTRQIPQQFQRSHITGAQHLDDLG